MTNAALMATIGSSASIDRDLESLAGAKDAWARLPIVRKTAYLEAIKRYTGAAAQAWVAAASRAKGLRDGSALAGEEWISGPWALLYALNRYIRTLNAIDNRGEPPLPQLRTRNGQVVLDVFPRTPYDRVLLNGITAQVRMLPGLDERAVRARAGRFYREVNPAGSVTLVLGAGNISSIAPLDVLYHLLAHGSVCLLKMNPVNEYLSPIFEHIFHPIADAGFLRFAGGGADVGAYLCSHPLVDRIHVTGSEQTYKAIAAAAGASKPITAELGNVSPTIVVPGNWNAEDVEFQAAHIATQKAHNAGFNCIAAQVLVLPKEWTHTEALRSAVARVLEHGEARPEYYPGARERRAALAGDGSPLRTVVDVDAADTSHAALTGEAFCGILACVRLPGGTDEYLRRAVEFANTVLRGTLGANLIVHPGTLRARRKQVEDAIDSLRYGCVGVNAWTGVGYFITETPWGAYPGHTPGDPGSGIGVVHNSYFLEGTEKSVVRAPFAPFPRSWRTGETALLPLPPWFVTNPRAAEIGRALCDFEAAHSPLTAGRVIRLAM